MTGHEPLIAARLKGFPVGNVSLLLDGKADCHERDGVWHFAIGVKSDETASADLRCCQGLAVFIHAPSLADGLPLFERLMDFEPALAAICAPDSVVRYDKEGMEQWDM